jgi:hypothetical protein
MSLTEELIAPTYRLASPRTKTLISNALVLDGPTALQQAYKYYVCNDQRRRCGTAVGWRYKLAPMKVGFLPRTKLTEIPPAQVLGSFSCALDQVKLVTLL